MYTFLIVVYLVVCACLVMVILMQGGKGGGLSETLGGAFQSVFGPKVTTVLVKATYVLAALFIIMSITLAKMSTQKSKSLMENLKEETGSEQSR